MFQRFEDEARKIVLCVHAMVTKSDNISPLLCCVHIQCDMIDARKLNSQTIHPKFLSALKPVIMILVRSYLH